MLPVSASLCVAILGKTGYGTYPAIMACITCRDRQKPSVISQFFRESFTHILQTTGVLLILELNAALNSWLRVWHQSPARNSVQHETSAGWHK